MVPRFAPWAYSSGLSADAETKIVNDTQTCFRSKGSVNLLFVRDNCSSNELSAIIVCYFNEMNQSIITLISWPIMVCSHCHWPTVTLWIQVLYAEVFILPRDRDRHWSPFGPVSILSVSVSVSASRPVWIHHNMDIHYSLVSYQLFDWKEYPTLVR